MRSRLEARYAASLDRLGVDWSYEPMCFADSVSQYLPDFELHRLGRHMYVEVKPSDSLAEAALARMHVIRSSVPDAILMVVVPRFGDERFQVGAGCHLGSSGHLRAGDSPWACACSIQPVQLELAAA